ncbi:MAG: amidohydrolase family protein [Acidimicrobiia bacterium]
MKATTPQIIDIHSHYVPRALMLHVADRPVGGVAAVTTGPNQFHFEFPGSQATRALPAKLIDIEDRGAWMTDQGIEMQVLTTWADIFGYGLEERAGIEWSRALNDTLLGAISGDDRYRALATLPMQSVDGATDVMDEALRNGFAGVTIGAQIDGDELDHERFDPFWQAASDFKAAVLIHPAYLPGQVRTAAYGLTNAVGRGMDTTIAGARLLGAGIPERYPDARIILSHGGGALPYLMGRLIRNREIMPELPDPNLGFARLLFDTVVFEPDTLRFLIGRASPGAVLLGSDYPFPIGDPQPLRVVAEAGIGESARDSVLGASAIAALGGRI